MAEPATSFQLSMATIEWLIDQGFLEPTRASLFGLLVGAPRLPTEEPRSATAERELGRRPPPVLEQALDIAARPEARIRITTQSPGQPPRQITFLTGSSSVVQAGLNAEGFLLGAPMTLDTLQALLIDELRSAPPDSGVPDRLVTPGALGLLTSLWPKSDHGCAEGVSLKSALLACQGLGADEPAAQRWVEALVASTLVEQNDAALSTSEAWRPWLERFWSGEHCEIEVVPLPEGELNAASLARNRQRLLFVGLKGQRLAVRMIDETSLDEVPLGVPISPGQDGAVGALSYLDDTFLAQNVATLLRLTLEGLAASDAIQARQPYDSGSPRP
jgi:hypothetical protein